MVRDGCDAASYCDDELVRRLISICGLYRV